MGSKEDEMLPIFLGELFEATWLYNLMGSKEDEMLWIFLENVFEVVWLSQIEGSNKDKSCHEMHVPHLESRMTSKSSLGNMGSILASWPFWGVSPQVLDLRVTSNSTPGKMGSIEPIFEPINLESRVATKVLREQRAAFCLLLTPPPAPKNRKSSDLLSMHVELHLRERLWEKTRQPFPMLWSENQQHPIARRKSVVKRYLGVPFGDVANFLMAQCCLLFLKHCWRCSSKSISF